jgi:nucleoside-diphosphate-sugar epimerase
VRPTFRGDPKPFKGDDKILPGLTADVTKVETLEGAIKDASVVIFAASASSKGGKAKDVDYLGVANVARECVRLGVPRLVVISSGAVTRPDSLGYKITNLFGNIMEWKVKGEDLLKQIYDEAGNPSLSYVIVRPGGLQDGPAKGANEIAINQGDTISGEINRDDVAACVAAAATSKSIPKRVTFEIYGADSGGPLEGRFSGKSGYERKGASYEEMFVGLKEGNITI